MSKIKTVVCIAICIMIIILSLSAIYYILYKSECTHGMYEIEINSCCLSNDSVGNDWVKTYVLNNRIISGSETITVPLEDKTPQILNVTITERDKYSDTASKNIQITLGSSETVTEIISIEENNGKFKGNKAIWEIKISVKHIKNRFCFKCWSN